MEWWCDCVEEVVEAVFANKDEELMTLMLDVLSIIPMSRRLQKIVKLELRYEI